MKGRFQGLYVSVITCFDRREEIDEKALKQHLEFLLDSDVDGIVCCADTGEESCLTKFFPQVHFQIIEITFNS